MAKPSLYNDFLLQVTVVWVTWNLFLLAYNLYVLLTTSSFWNNSSAILLKYELHFEFWSAVWLHDCTEYAVLEVKTNIFPLWQCNELSKTLLIYYAAVVSQNRKNLPLKDLCRGLGSWREWKVLCSTKLLMFYHKVREGVQKTHTAYSGDAYSCVAATQTDWPVCGTCRGASAQAETVQELHCRLRDNTFLLKLTESSTVHLLRLYERETICPRLDCTVLILSCWEGWCAQLTLLWKVEVILGSLHFANSGE